MLHRLQKRLDVRLVIRCNTDGLGWAIRFEDRFAEPEIAMAGQSGKMLLRSIWREEGFRDKQTVFLHRIVAPDFALLPIMDRTIVVRFQKPKTYARMRKAINLLFQTWSDHESGFITSRLSDENVRNK